MDINLLLFYFAALAGDGIYNNKTFTGTVI